VDQFIVDKDGEVGDKTLHNILTLLGTMLKLAQRLKWLAGMPQIDKPKLQEPDYQWFQTGDEIRRFLVGAKQESEMVLVLFSSAVYTGMRVGELLGLRWEDVSFDRRLITVKRSYGSPYTKNRGLRHVPILNPLLPVLRDWRLRQPGELVFPTRDGTVRQPSDRLVSKIYKEVLERVGVSKIRFHDLRHTFASHWVLNGGDIFRLKTILGHREIRSTMRYAHLAPEAFAEDYGRLPDLLPSGASVASLEERRAGEGR